jgi:hypothetical protein
MLKNREALITGAGTCAVCLEQSPKTVRTGCRLPTEIDAAVGYIKTADANYLKQAIEQLKYSDSTAVTRMY